MSPSSNYKCLPWAENASKVYQSGRLIVGLETDSESRLDFYNSEGSNLPAYLIYVAFKIILGKGWVEEFEGLHLNRQNKWKADVYLDRQGFEEYRLYTLEQNKSICSSQIIISSGKIHSFSIRVEDVTPLLRKIIENYPPVFLPRLRNYRYTYFFPDYHPFYTLGKTATSLRDTMKVQREETQSIRVDKTLVQTGIHSPGVTSGIIEAIEALKCMEVFMA